MWVWLGSVGGGGILDCRVYMEVEIVIKLGERGSANSAMPCMLSVPVGGMWDIIN
jgi:hypothetical protein